MSGYLCLLIWHIRCANALLVPDVVKHLTIIPPSVVVSISKKLPLSLAICWMQTFAGDHSDRNFLIGKATTVSRVSPSNVLVKALGGWSKDVYKPGEALHSQTYWGGGGGGRRLARRSESKNPKISIQK